MRAQPVERDLGVVRPERPLGMKLGARGVEEQQLRRRSLLDQQLEQLQRRRVDPMQIFGRDYGRLHAGGTQRPLH